MLIILLSLFLFAQTCKAQPGAPETTMWPPREILAPETQHPDFQPVPIPKGWDRKRLNRALNEYLKQLTQEKFPAITVKSKDDSITMSFNEHEYDLDGFAIQKGTKPVRRPVVGPADNGFIVTVHFAGTVGRLTRPQFIDTAPWPIFLGQRIFLPELDLCMNMDVHYGPGSDLHLLAELCAPTRWLKTMFEDPNADWNLYGDYLHRIGGDVFYKLSPEHQFSRIRSLSKEIIDPNHAMRMLEDFADKHPQLDLAGEAQFRIADIIREKLNDLDGAVAKLKWTAANFPNAAKQQYHTISWIPDNMFQEWQAYVHSHPILIKDYAWFQMAEFYQRAKRYHDALACYDSILATVSPDEIPDTKNYAIATTFRLHKCSLEQKLSLLRRLKKDGQAHLAAAELERLYPEAAWKKLEREADLAFGSYVEENKKLEEARRQEESRRREEEHKRAQEQAAILWRDQVSSTILKENELAKLGHAFPHWKIKQITWPSSELWMAHVRVNDELKNSCIDWLKKFLNQDYLPSNLHENLIAMKDWGLIRNESEQERLCDVFVTTFKKDPYVIHIQESPYNVVIAVADDRLVNDARTDHKDFVIEMAASVLNEALKTHPDSENLHVLNVPTEGPKVTRLSWLIESVLFTDEASRKSIDLAKASEVGTRHVDAETDGRFVRFDVVKCIYGARAFLDPYVQRFPWPKMRLSEIVKAEAKTRDFSEVSPVSRFRYKGYHADDLVRFVAAARTRHRFTEAVEAGLLALSRHLTPDQDAFVRDEMARAYEALSAGPLAKEKYKEVLELHPDYERNIEIAYRLAELNNSIIMEGTQRNAQRAIEYYQYVLDRCNELNKDSQKVYYLALAAHMGLGILYWDKKDYARAKGHFEAIHKADLDLAEPLPHKRFDSPRDLADRKRWLKDTVRIVKSRVPGKIVGTCIRPNPKETVVELENLITEYADDPNIADLARKALNQQQDRMRKAALEEELERAKEHDYRPDSR